MSSWVYVRYLYEDMKPFWNALRPVWNLSEGSMQGQAIKTKLLRQCWILAKTHMKPCWGSLGPVWNNFESVTFQSFETVGL